MPVDIVFLLFRIVLVYAEPRPCYCMCGQVWDGLVYKAVVVSGEQHYKLNRLLHIYPVDQVLSQAHSIHLKVAFHY